MNQIPVYELSNNLSCDALYARIFSEPGILIIKEFPLTESRFRVLRKSFSYEEIVEELFYCIGSIDSAKNLARLVKDDLLLQDAFFLYPETIRVLTESSVATVVKDIHVKQQLSLMYPNQPVYYFPDDDHTPLLNAFGTLKKLWRLPAGFPRHLQPLHYRVEAEIAKRIQFPENIFAHLKL